MYYHCAVAVAVTLMKHITRQKTVKFLLHHKF